MDEWMDRQTDGKMKGQTDGLSFSISNVAGFQEVLRVLVLAVAGCTLLHVLPLSDQQRTEGCLK